MTAKRDENDMILLTSEQEDVFAKYLEGVETLQEGLDKAIEDVKKDKADSSIKDFTDSELKEIFLEQKFMVEGAIWSQIMEAKREAIIKEDSYKRGGNKIQHKYYEGYVDAIEELTDIIGKDFLRELKG